MDSTFQFGVARREITPPLGTQIDGDLGSWRPASFVMDPLHAKALVLQQGERRYALVTLDTMGITHLWVDTLRSRIHERFGIPPSAVLIHAIQNHSGPCVGNFHTDDQPLDLGPGLALRNVPAWALACGADSAYAPFVVEQVLAAVGQAVDQLEPGWFGVVSGLETRVAHNRRFVMRDGTSSSGLWRPTSEMLHAEGPTDPEVGVAVFVNRRLQTRAMLLHHTAHPIFGWAKRYISADWPGAWSRAVEREYGLEGAALVLNGCCGNVSPHSALGATCPRSAEEAGAWLTAAVRPALELFTLAAGPAIASASRTIPLPLREIQADTQAADRELLRLHPEPRYADESREKIAWDWIYAATRLALAERMRHKATYDYEVQALRIGPLAIVALTGEPFVELQLEVKARSPFARTFPAHMSNGYVGYIPTERALAGGGFETWPAQWSKLAACAHARIVETTLAMLNDLHAQA